MKVIKKVLLMLIAFLFIKCNSDETQISYDDSIGEFVYFKLQVDSNNDVLESPEIYNNEVAISKYTKDNFKTLKIPVILTTASIEEEVTINFSTELSNIDNVEITPKNAITFDAEKRVDTIYVNFKERWNVEENPEIKFVLTETSDSAINLGFPNEENLNNSLTINFSELEFSYQFASSLTEIIGDKGEEIIIDVEFSNGYAISDIEDMDLIIESESNFTYSLERLPLDDSSKISYTFTLEEAISIDELEFETILSLKNIDNYTLLGTEAITIRKPVFVDRDNLVFTAANFYNLSDPFYRTYGENWMDFNEDEICSWQTFSTFTVPVIVVSNHPNAILYSDQGTVDENDDVYHHAFKVGFKSPTSITTNPFNLKRWFNNELTASPGFEILEALEFFPENGTSTIKGIVRVVSQDLIISNTSGDSFTIAISGEGTYQLLNTGVYEISLALEAKNDVLFGGTRTSYYKIYNNNSYSDPEDLNENCFIPVDL